MGVQGFVWQWLLLIGLLCASSMANAIERTQTITLKKGWNSVFIEVDSEVKELNVLFADTPIDLVATFFYPLSSTEFIKDPNEEKWNKSTWNKWIAPSRPDAFLTNLYRLLPGRGYLVHSTVDYTWNVSGAVELYKLKWQPNSFTLTGFPVTSQSSPSVHQLVDISQAHANQKIYSLDNSGDVAHWQEVTDRIDTAIEKGKAYWVYTKGGSEYFSGALEVKLSDTHVKAELNFIDIVDIQRFTLRNASNKTLTVNLTLVDNQVPLVVIEKDPTTFERTYRSVTEVLFDEPLTIPVNEEVEVVLQVDRKSISPNETVEGLIKVTDDIGGTASGSEYWIPVKARGVVE